MINSNELTCKINDIQTPENGFNLIKINEKYWGKTSKGEIVFSMETVSKEIVSMSQTTRYLKLYINVPFNVSLNGKNEEKNLSGLVLTSKDEKHLDIFVRLTLTLANDVDENKLLKHFLNLKELFSNTKKVSEIELQGMYGELLAMYILKINYGLDISKYYQRIDKTKFDFAISEKKKIEVKSTTKPERVHHFLQTQLDVDSNDIKVISIMLQRDDAGMSLFDLINECKDLFSHNLFLIVHIESMINNVDKDDLKSIVYNFEYSKSNFRFYDAANMPRLKEKNEEGVFNVEYDVDLTNTVCLSSGKLIDWVLKQ